MLRTSLRIGAALATALFATAPAALEAQALFSATAASPISGNTLTLSVKNVSGGAPASNPSSVLTEVGLGNILTTYDITGCSYVGQGSWSLDQEVNGYSLLAEDPFGADAQGDNGIRVGQTTPFSFVASTSFEASQFAYAEIAFHDQGPRCSPLLARTAPLLDGSGAVLRRGVRSCHDASPASGLRRPS